MDDSAIHPPHRGGDPTSEGGPRRGDRDGASDAGESTMSSLTSPSGLNYFRNDGPGEDCPPATAFAAERAKWLAFVSGLRLSTRIDDNKDADRSWTPVAVLLLMYLMCCCTYLPLFLNPPGEAEFSWDFNSPVFKVVVALSLGSCLLTLTELTGALAEQLWESGEEPDGSGLLYLSISRFLLVASHCITFTIVLVSSMKETLPFSLLFCLLNNWWCSKLCVCYFFALVHLTHLSSAFYLFLFAVFTALISMINYAHISDNYSGNSTRFTFPLLVLFSFSQMYFSYSIYAAIKAGRYRARDGSLSVPAFMTLVLLVSLVLLFVIEVAFQGVLANRGMTKTYPLWVSCFHPVCRTAFILVVTMMPVRLSRLLAAKTRRFLRDVPPPFRPIAADA